jgi:hypothetical protein
MSCKTVPVIEGGVEVALGLGLGADLEYGLIHSSECNSGTAI